MEPGLEATAFFDPSNFVYPFGTHVCVVEVDGETGEVESSRYVAVDDCGPQINPMIVEGQVHGGVVQGIGRGAARRSPSTTTTASWSPARMMDYAMPKAEPDAAHRDRPHRHAVAGQSARHQGLGEAGTIASAACVVNAVCDALAPLGIRHIDKPLTPARVWAAIQAAKAKKEAETPG